MRSADFGAHIAYSVSEPVGGLTSGTTYHYSLCADDPDPGGARSLARPDLCDLRVPPRSGVCLRAGHRRRANLEFDVGAAGLLRPLIPPTVAWPTAHLGGGRPRW